jgi:hypothetical protein
MKSRVEKTPPPNCCPVTDRRGSSWPARSRKPSEFAFPLAVLLVVLCVTASAQAQTTPALNGQSPISALGCTVAKKGKKMAKQHRNVLPDSSPKDLDDANGGLDDVDATTATRHDQDTPWLTTATLNTIALPEPGFVPAFLFSTHSSDSPREHVRERAPPFSP